jgi:Ser/Thr protein kinase RdoA (MazF antagonist)
VKQVGGILDFGDMVHTWLVAELAILTAYIMASHEGEWEEKCRAATHAQVRSLGISPLTIAAVDFQTPHLWRASLILVDFFFASYLAML